METVPLAAGWRGEGGREQGKKKPQLRPEPVEPWSAVDKFMAVLVLLFVIGGMGVGIGGIVTATSQRKPPPPSPPSGPPPFLPPPSPPAAANSLYEALFPSMARR